MPLSEQDLAKPPRWEYGPADSLFIAKGSFALVALIDAGDGKGTISLYKLDASEDWELIGWRDNKRQAVQFAEEIVARWFPNDPCPVLPPRPKSPDSKPRN